MKVYVVSEDNHGVVGVVSSVENAVNLLIDQDWLAPCADVWDDESVSFKPIKEKFGEDWKTVLMNMSEEQFSEAFQDWLYLDEYELDKF